MKIQLDTDKKIIKIEDNVLLSKLIETLDKLLPNKEWKKFTLETNTIINNWNSPIIIRQYPVYPKPYYPYPWYDGTQYFMNQQNDSKNITTTLRNKTLNSGIYNVEV